MTTETKLTRQQLLQKIAQLENARKHAISAGHPPTIPGGTVSTEAAWREWAYGGGNTNFWGQT